MNCSTYDSPDPDTIHLNFKKSIELMPKFRYKIKEIMGDYYYEEMSIEETCRKALIRPESPDKILKSQAEIDEYIRDNINEKMPLDGPLMRIYYQSYNPIDQDHLPEDQRSKGLLIWKCHHSFCDGVSVMCMTLALTQDYSRDYFIASKDASFLQQAAIKLMVPFMLPKVLMNTTFARQDKNCFTKRKLEKNA